MEANKVNDFIREVLKNMPADWLKLTTHRLDIYDEELAKTQFLEEFENLFKSNTADSLALSNLPTAYDYIRLGHPLSCILEWTIAKLHDRNSNQVISFSSQTMPILAILRKNLLTKRKTLITYQDTLPDDFETDLLKQVYGYSFNLKRVANTNAIGDFDGSTLFISTQANFSEIDTAPSIDFSICLDGQLGSIVLVNGEENDNYISEIQHVRRRESIAMTPHNCLTALNRLINTSSYDKQETNRDADEEALNSSINQVTGINTKPLIASSGLSMQYAIMMGLIHDAQENHPGKAIKFIVPPNCYGGTNDQARRVVACIDQIEIIDLLVDGENDMVQSIDTILAAIAQEDALAYIIAEIPTNPRVEVPDLIALKEVLSKPRKTSEGEAAVDPVFILDQTFCPNVHFLGDGEVLSTVRAIAYVSGSKFPSGGLCTAGYCVGNLKSKALMEKIETHLKLCDNEATNLQVKILAQQMPSMNQRIIDAYQITRNFVNFIYDVLPDAKINFVSEVLANQGFTPSVFSLDLPTKGNTDEERESYKRALNLKLIDAMITEIPHESKFCVSYGQLNGCYWTIPATSTQGTTKEGDKDYIVRVSLSPNVDLDLHKKVFLDFVKEI